MAKKLFSKSVIASQMVNTYRLEITEFTKQHFIEAVAIEGLSNLSLNKTSFDPTDLVLVKECKSLETLSISSPKVKVPLTALESISGMPIKFLTLRCMEITDQDLKAFPSFPKLITLDLGGNLIKGDGLSYVAKACPQLEWLGLPTASNNDFDDPIVASHLIDALKSFKHLETIQIDSENTSIVDAVNAYGKVEVQ